MKSEKHIELRPGEPMRFRPNPTELEDMDIFLNKLKLYRTKSGAIHAALDKGFRQMKIERGLIPIEKIDAN
jgi:hypothetical protein